MSARKYIGCALLFATTILPLSFGCGGKGEPTPQQKEEKRQQMIKNTEREQREIQGKSK